MNILDKIIETKKLEVAQRKKQVTTEKLKTSAGFNRNCLSLKKALSDPSSIGIIAEFKTKSPSKGIINPDADVVAITKGYSGAGARCLSVLTDYEYFGGSAENLVRARAANPLTPILRKDFMIDSYQVFEAKSWGADVILLIAACLEKKEAILLAETAKSLGLEVLMEVHDANELEIVNDWVDFVGINNRNLKTFEVNIQTSVRLASLIPERFIKVSESGIEKPETINYLKTIGYKGFLIGETFMKTTDPGLACKKFIEKLLPV